jgi:hypothetical protein
MTSRPYLDDSLVAVKSPVKTVDAGRLQLAVLPN